VSGRRAQLVKQVRAAQKKKAAPLLLCLPRWAFRPGEARVIVIRCLEGRPPTDKEVSDFELETFRQWAAEVQAERERVAHQQSQSPAASERPEENTPDEHAED
jgi:hypothetical protein